MKKILVALLALSITGFAFAADAPTVQSSFSAYLDTGFQYNATKDFLYTNGNDTGVLNGRLNFNGSFSYGDFGVKFRFRNQNVMAMSSSSNTMSLRRAYAYYNLFNKMVEVDVGGLGVATYYTPWNGVGFGDNPNNGAMVQVKPMAGLGLAFFAPVSNATVDTNGNVTNATSLSNTFKSSAAAVSYSLDKVGDFLFDVVNLTDSTNLYFIGSFNLTAVDGATGIVEVRYNDTFDSDAAKLINVTLVGGYNVTKEFNATVVAGLKLPNSGSMTWSVNPELAYTLDDVNSAGADFTYNSDGTYSADGWYKAVLGKNFIKGVAAYDGTDFKVTGSFVSSF